VCVRSIYSFTAIRVLARNDQPTEFDRRKVSLNSARSTDVAVPYYLLTLAQLSANSGRLIVTGHSRECSGVRAIMWGFMLLPGLLRKHLFIYYSPITQFPRAEILNYRNYVRNGYDAGSKIANVSARHATLKRWTVTDKRWNKKVVSQGSIVTSVKRLPICTKNSWVLTLMGPSVSSATGKKSWVPLSELCLFLFF